MLMDMNIDGKDIFYLAQCSYFTMLLFWEYEEPERISDVPKSIQPRDMMKTEIPWHSASAHESYWLPYFEIPQKQTLRQRFKHKWFIWVVIPWTTGWAAGSEIEKRRNQSSKFLPWTTGVPSFRGLLETALIMHLRVIPPEGQGGGSGGGIYPISR